MKYFIYIKVKNKYKIKPRYQLNYQAKISKYLEIFVAIFLKTALMLQTQNKQEEDVIADN